MWAQGLHLSGTTSQPYTASHLTLTRCGTGVSNQGQTLWLENSILTQCELTVSTIQTGQTTISYDLFYDNRQDFALAEGSALIKGSGILTSTPNFVDFPHNFY